MTAPQELYKALKQINTLHHYILRAIALRLPHKDFTTRELNEEIAMGEQSLRRRLVGLVRYNLLSTYNKRIGGSRISFYRIHPLILEDPGLLELCLQERPMGIPGYEKNLEIPEEAREVINRDMAPVFITTFDSTGSPLIAPSFFNYSSDKATIICALYRHHPLFINLTRYSGVHSLRRNTAQNDRHSSIFILGKDNTSFELICRHGVIKAPSATHPDFHLVRFDAITIKEQSSPLRIITNSPTYSIPDGIPAAFFQQIHIELRSNQLLWR